MRHHFTYDAWNRMVKAQADSSGSPGDTIAEYPYHGLNRRIAKLIPDGSNWDRTDYYYTTGWQVIEERFVNDQSNENKENPATAVKYQYVWDIRYIDAPVLRWRDNDENPDLEETLYYTNDANMNVTALVDASNGNVVERYMYDPYGQVTIYNSDWSGTVTWANSKQNHILYCGYYYDNETGLYQVRNRVYHWTLAWLQRDLIGYADGMNLYEYVKNAPINSVDPAGEYGAETHYSLTGHLATTAGFCWDASLAIARANQGQDEDNLDALTQGFWSFLLIGLPFGTGEQYQVHFPGADPPSLLSALFPKRVEAGREKNAKVREFIARAKASCDAEDIGKALHALQDSYAHEGFPDLGGHPKGRELSLSPEQIVAGEKPESQGLFDKRLDDPLYDLPRYGRCWDETEKVLVEFVEKCYCKLCPEGDKAIITIPNQ